MTQNALFLAGALVVGAGFSAGADWPAWRGPNGDGIASGANPPLRWGLSENVRWRVPLPEAGNSTPIVWKERVFVTQAEKEKNRRTLMCFNRADGRLLWQSGVTVGHMERTHDTNPHASASPVTDGERIVCWFGSAGLVAYDFEGNELWRADLGRHDHQFGYGGSPVIHGGLVFLNFGPGTREFLVAVNKETGKEAWRHASSTPGQDDILGTWSTPFVAEWEGGVQVISALRDELAGLEAATGRVIWRTGSSGNQAKSSPVAGEGIVVLSGDMTNPEVALRLGGRGEISDAQLLWRRTPPKRRVGTGVIRDGHIYGVQTIGIADCVNLATGEVVWEERLRGPGVNTAIWTSPVLAAGRLYVVNQSGDAFVYRAQTSFDLLAVNPSGERSNSSVAVSGNDLFLRTHEALWRIGGN